MKQNAGLLKKVNKIDKTVTGITTKRKHKLPISGMKQNISLQTLQASKVL